MFVAAQFTAQYFVKALYNSQKIVRLKLEKPGRIICENIRGG